MKKKLINKLKYIHQKYEVKSEIIIKYILFVAILIYIKKIIFFSFKYRRIKSPQLEFWSETMANFNASELNNDEERKLFFRNLTEFYYLIRKNYLFKYNVSYNESNLLTFQDKLNYLVIHESPQYKSIIVDKIKLRDYGKKILGKNICVPIIRIYERVEDINFQDLPNKFVLKYNHGSGMNIICEDKNNFNISEAKIKLNEWKNINYGLLTTEFQYLYVKRRILVEKFLKKNINDYKIYCFNGKPKFILTKKMLDEKRGIYVKQYYNNHWKLIELELYHYNHTPKYKFEKPKNLKLMLKYAKLLSQEFAFVRVDLYELDNQVFLGELTFTPLNSFKNWKNEKTGIRIGNLIDIKKIKKYLFNK